MPEQSKTVQMACSVLQELEGTYGGLSLRELAQRTEKSKTAILRVLATLAEYGLVATDANGRWEIGPAVVNMARARLRNMPLLAEALPVLRTLVASTGCTGYLGQVRADSAVVLHMEMGSQPVVVMAQPGQVYPAHSVAFGLAVLCEMSDRDIAATYKEHTFAPGDWAGDVAKVLEEVRRARRRGFTQAAVMYEGMRAYGIALLTSAGHVGISLSMAVQGLSESAVGEREALVLRELARARASMGTKGGV